MDDPSEPRAARVGRDTTAAAQPVRTSVAISFGSPATESGVTRLDQINKSNIAWDAIGEELS